MPLKTLTIDSYIGQYGYSKQWVNQIFTGADNDEIEVHISSLGGSVDHAMAIHDRFATHGNVTAIFTGMVASAATMIALGAKKTRMSRNSMYLIHKAMIGIDIFDNLNEDDIDALIFQLEKDKNELAKTTLVIARMYAAKGKMLVKDILDLMKQQTWLTADQAKSWGFVDEVFTPSQVVNYADDLNMVALIQANGYPIPERSTQPERPAVDEESLINRLLPKLKDLFKPKHTPMNKQFLNLNKALKVEKLESTDEGVFLNEEQLNSIDQEMAACIQADNARIQAETARAQAETARAQAETARAQAETARTTAETALSNAISELDTIGETVSKAENIADKVAAIKTTLAQKPGAKPSGVQGKKDPEIKNEGVDWETLNALPHMKETD